MISGISQQSWRDVHVCLLPGIGIQTNNNRMSPQCLQSKSFFFLFIDFCLMHILIWPFVLAKLNDMIPSVCVYIFWQHFFVDTNFIKHYRHFMATYFLLDPFEFPYYFYRIWGELIYVLSIVVCILSTFCPTLGHHQGRIYYKSDVTFVLAYYYDVRSSLPLKIMAFAFKWNSIIKCRLQFSNM